MTQFAFPARQLRSGEGTVQVWDLLTGTLRYRLGGHTGPSPGIAVAYNADGTPVKE